MARTTRKRVQSSIGSGVRAVIWYNLSGLGAAACTSRIVVGWCCRASLRNEPFLYSWPGCTPRVCLIAVACKKTPLERRYEDAAEIPDGEHTRGEDAYAEEDAVGVTRDERQCPRCPGLSAPGTSCTHLRLPARCSGATTCSRQNWTSGLGAGPEASPAPR